MIFYMKNDTFEEYASNFLEDAIKYIESLKESDLRLLNLNNLNEFVSKLGILAAFVKSNIGKTFYRFRLSLYLKCLTTSLLTVRLYGLNEIKNFLSDNSFNLQQKKEENVISNEEICNWIFQNNIIEYLYGDQIHLELISRSGFIPFFLVQEKKLSREHVDLIWNASRREGVNDNIQLEVYKTIGDLPLNLDEQMTQYIFEKIKNVPLQSCDIPFLGMLERFTRSALKDYENKNKKRVVISIDIDMSDEDEIEQKKAPQHFYGLEIFWELLQEETNVANKEVERYSFNALDSILHENKDFNVGLQKINLIEKSIENIKKGKSVINSLALIEKIFQKKNPVVNEAAQDDSLPNSTRDTVELYEKDFSLLNLVSQELVDFHKLAISKAQNTENLDKLFFCGVTYKENLLSRMRFLRFLTMFSSLFISKENIEMIWSNFIENNHPSFLEYDRTILVKWLSETLNLLKEPCISTENLCFIFSEKILKGDLSNLNFELFDLAKNIFCYVNHKENRIKIFNINDFTKFVVLSFELFGLDSFLKLIFSSQNTKIVDSSTNLILMTQRKVSLELVSQLADFRKKFIENCVLNFQSQNEQTVERSINMLKLLILKYKESVPDFLRKINVLVKHTNSKNDYNLNVFPFDTIGKLKKEISALLNVSANHLRLIKGGKELKPSSSVLSYHGVTDASVIHCVSTQNQVEKIISKPKVSGVKIVDEPRIESQGDHSLNPSFIASAHFELIFKLLDSNFKISSIAWDVLMLLPKNEKRNEEIKYFYKQNHKWEELINSRSVYGLYYSLLIVDSICNEYSDNETKTLTEDAIIWRDQFNKCGGVKYLSNVLINTNFLEKENQQKKIECLYLILNILKSFYLIEDCLNETLDKYIEPAILINKLMEIIKKISILADKEDNQNTERIAEIIQKILVAMSFSKPLANLIENYQDLEGWLGDLLVSCFNEKVRKINVETIQSISFFSDNANLILEKLLSIMKNQNESSNELFCVINHLLQNVLEKGNSFPTQNCLKIFQVVSKRVIEHPISERSYSKDIDFELIGLLNILSSLSTSKEEIRIEARKTKFIEHILNKCLFEYATVENNGPFCPPKCKSSKSRKAAFKLLLELSKDTTNYEIISSSLAEDHKDGHKNTLWYYSTENYEKDPCGYVGLLNLGATCYINSLTQQLFMVPEFRHSILSKCSVDQSQGK